MRQGGRSAQEPRPFWAESQMVSQVGGWGSVVSSEIKLRRTIHYRQTTHDRQPECPARSDPRKHPPKILAFRLCTLGFPRVCFWKKLLILRDFAPSPLPSI